MEVESGGAIAMSEISIESYKSPYGEMLLGAYEGRLVLCDWRYRKMRTAIDQRIQREVGADYVEEGNETIELAKSQLSEYFERERRNFELPLLFVGTDFQKCVWESLLKVPYGRTATYSDLAEDMGNRESVRAVANANGANALSIFVPCHRIVGSDGKLVGYAGGLNAKKKLLELEFDLFS